MPPHRRVTAALVGLLALVMLGWWGRGWINGSPQHVTDRPTQQCSAPSTGAGSVSRVPGADSGLRICALSTLPPEVGRTRHLMETGGPFPNSQDGAVFGNRERRLPEKNPGYYHEYTVPTAGARDRGAQRLITGAAGELYYTADHYVTFVVVDPGR